MRGTETELKCRVDDRSQSHLWLSHDGSFQVASEHYLNRLTAMSTQPLLQRTASKRIALPIRVEPKVSFANERTFLSWLHFTVVLGGLAVGLLNFGDQVRILFLP